MEAWAGLVVAGATILVGWLFYRLMLFIFEFQYDLREYIFESNGNGLLRFALWFVWLPLYLITIVALVIAALCAASLLKDLIHWLKIEE